MKLVITVILVAASLGSPSSAFTAEEKKKNSASKICQPLQKKSKAHKEFCEDVLSSREEVLKNVKRWNPKK